jgi:hypothetical protein
MNTFVQVTLSLAVAAGINAGVNAGAAVDESLEAGTGANVAVLASGDGNGLPGLDLGGLLRLALGASDQARPPSR